MAASVVAVAGGGSEEDESDWVSRWREDAVVTAAAFVAAVAWWGMKRR